MSETAARADADPTWLLSRLEEERAVRHVLLLSSDGMVRACSASVDRATAERTAANASGVLSIGRSAAEYTGSSDSAPRKVVLDYDDRCILVFQAGAHTALAVAIDAPMLSQEVGVAITATLKTINSLRDVLSTRERTAS